MRSFEARALALATTVAVHGCGDPGARAARPAVATATATASSSGAVSIGDPAPRADANTPLVALSPLASSKPSEATDGVCALEGASVSGLAAAGGDVVVSALVPVARRAKVCGAEIVADRPTAVIAFIAAGGVVRWTWSEGGATVVADPVFSGDAVWAAVVRDASATGRTLSLLSLDEKSGKPRFELTWPAEYVNGLVPLEGGAVALAASSQHEADVRGRTAPAGGYVARVERDGVLGFVVSAPRVSRLAGRGEVLVAAAEKPFRLERMDPRTGRTSWSLTPPDDPRLEGLAVGDDGRVAILGTASERGGVGLGETGSAPTSVFGGVGETPAAVFGVWSASGELLHATKLDATGGAWGRSLAFVRGEIGIGVEVRGKGALGPLSVQKEGSLLVVASPGGEPLRLAASGLRALAGSGDGFVFASLPSDARALGATADADADELLVFRRGDLPKAVAR